MASPQTKTPPKTQKNQRLYPQAFKTQEILDLTTEETQSVDTSTDSFETIPPSIQFITQKRKRPYNSPPPQRKREKSIQWKPAETQQFQPQYPSNFLFNIPQQGTQDTSTLAIHPKMTPNFLQPSQQTIANMSPLFPTSSLLQTNSHNPNWHNQSNLTHPIAPNTNWNTQTSHITMLNQNPFQLFKPNNTSDNPFATTGSQQSS
jgi:hypothetical protein